MKSILVPIDFSETSLNALDYAADLAAISKSKLLILHIMHVPLIDETQIGTHNIMENMKEDAEDKLAELVAKLNQKHLVIDVEARAIFGLASDVVIEETEKTLADLVVMGTKGMTNLVSKVFGSITQAVVKRSIVPVLVVPLESKLKSIDRLLIAEDHVDTSERANRFMVQMLKTFHAELDIVSVEPNSDEYKTEVIVAENGKKEVAVWASTVVDGLKRYANEVGADIICARQHERDFISSLFHTSTTKTLISDIQLPVLILK